jgi:hypothetical protein
VDKIATIKKGHFKKDKMMNKRRMHHKNRKRKRTLLRFPATTGYVQFIMKSA